MMSFWCITIGVVGSANSTPNSIHAPLSINSVTTLLPAKSCFSESERSSTTTPPPTTKINVLTLSIERWVSPVWMAKSKTDCRVASSSYWAAQNRSLFGRFSIIDYIGNNSSNRRRVEIEMPLKLIQTPDKRFLCTYVSILMSTVL